MKTLFSNNETRETIFKSIRNVLSEMFVDYEMSNTLGFEYLEVDKKYFFMEHTFSLKYGSAVRLIFSDMLSRQKITSISSVSIFLKVPKLLVEEQIKSFIYELIFLGLLLDESVYKNIIINDV